MPYSLRPSLGTVNFFFFGGGGMKKTKKDFEGGGHPNKIREKRGLT